MASDRYQWHKYNWNRLRSHKFLRQLQMSRLAQDWSWWKDRARPDQSAHQLTRHYCQRLPFGGCSRQYRAGIAPRD
ncbi:MAG: hypothetical protein MUC94_09730 [bacterium]|nr:hypothetical protein [bacterium]